MRAVIKAFNQFIKEIWKDLMLAAMVFAPIVVGLIFYFALPFLEEFLCKKFAVAEILSPYYLLFDLLLCLMTPMMFAFAGIMVILGEIDNGISSYMMVTPLGKKGYLFSRIGIPSIIAVIYNIGILMIFSLTSISFLMIIVLSALSGLMCVIISLLVISFASNKVEGMAMTKLSGLLWVGLPIAFFVTAPMQYIAGMLPSLWLAKLALTQDIIFIIPTIITSLLWIILLYRKFIKKII